MRSIDVGQPTLCREIDFLSLMSSHSVLETSTNDELRQISDTGAPAWSCDNPPPSLRCNRSWGGTPQTIAHHRCMASLWLMHSSVLFLFALMASMSLVGILWLFANTADASAYTCHFFLSCLVQAPILSLLTWLGCQVQCKQPHDTFSTGDTGNMWAEEMSGKIRSQHVEMCCLLSRRPLFIIMP